MDHKSLYAWVGGWVEFTYIILTEIGQLIKDRKNPLAIQLFSISLASFVQMLVTASTCFIEICCCARVCGHKHLPAALASMPSPFWRLRARAVSFSSFENA